MASAAKMKRDSLVRWSYVGLAFVECLVGTGVVFGFSGLQVALIRDGVYEELCPGGGGDGDQGRREDRHCDGQKVRLAAIYSAGATSFQVSMMGWGYLMDLYGSALVRVSSLVLSIVGCVLMAIGESRTFDSFIPAAILLGSGGAGFFFSHFVLADHFRHGGNFGLIHAILNSAMDSATITFFGVELVQERGWASVRASFLSLAAVYALFALITPLWGKFLSPAVRDDDHVDDGASEDLVDQDDDDAVLESGGAGASPVATRHGAHATASSDGGDRAAVDVSKLPFSRQLLTPHFMFIALWSFVSSTRILFLLGTVEGQAEYNGGGRSSAQAKELVGWFNILLMVANVLTPLFGLLLDKYGIAVGLLLVNVMGVVIYALLFSPGVAGLCVAYAMFGCFRVWNFTSISSYTQMVFGHESFGRVFGTGANFFNVLAALIQYPLAGAALQNKSFAVIDVVIIAASIPLFSFPAWIHFGGARADGPRKGRAAKSARGSVSEEQVVPLLLDAA